MCSVCSSGQWSGGGSPPAWSRFADLELSFSFYVQGILARRSLRLCGILVASWLGCGGAWWWQPLYFQASLNFFTSLSRIVIRLAGVVWLYLECSTTFTLPNKYSSWSNEGFIHLRL
ncbi:hypothetical protein Bca52824_072054 [Brassica carinata]|uniref:Uncharacterized protein n=1 Tax=Brassica carinata TaxID=52824 RepID=A0A8X7U3L0_BRACI|nr:hypothetical protein Bca52824_072054 [Brassica carinata]